VRSRANVLLLCSIVLIGAAVPSVCSAGPIFEEKGTLTMGLHGQYGLLVGDAPAADDFDSGLGYGLRLRYYLGGNRALGISLDRQTFEGAASSPTADRPEEMNVAIITMDYYWYFDRKSDLPRYISIGAGVHHPSKDYSEYSNNAWVPYSKVGPDGIVVSIGAGVEHFFHRVAAVDFSVRGHALLGQGGALGSVEATMGLNFYIIE
jgi:hypothetical protein